MLFQIQGVFEQKNETKMDFKLTKISEFIIIFFLSTNEIKSHHNSAIIKKKMFLIVKKTKLKIIIKNAYNCLRTLKTSIKRHLCNCNLGIIINY